MEVMVYFRLEMYCRDLTSSYDDVYVISGPVMIPQVQPDGKKRMVYEVGTLYIRQ